MATPNLFQPVYEDQHKNASVGNDLKVGNDLSVCGNTFLKNVKKLDGSSMNNIRDILGDQYKELYSSITGTMSFGTSIATSTNCEIVAVGDPGYENGKGVVKVYKFLKDGGYWNQIGTDLKGQTQDQQVARGPDDYEIKNGDRAGTSVALSANGKIVAVGTPFFDSSNSLNLKYDGIVRVYEWNGTSWIRRGNDDHLKGSSPSNDDQAGTTVALSDDGNTIIVGAPKYNPYGSVPPSGIARVYKWNGTDSEWKSMGYIDGATGIGSDVDINGDGTVIISGAPAWGSDYQGTAVVYDLDHNVTGMWRKRGNTDSLQGISQSESGYAVAISKDGTRVLMGIPRAGTGKGTARVYDWNGNTSTWTRKGLDSELQGISDTDGAGTSVSMSGDGNVIAIGYKYSETSLSYPVKLYYWNGEAWNKIGDRIEIKTTVAQSFVNFFSSSLSLNHDGTLMLLGARSSASEEAGKVQLFSSKKSIIDNDLNLNNVKISNTLELGEGISIINSTYSSLNYLDKIDISHPKLETFYLNNEYLMIGNPGANEVKIWKLKSTKNSFDFQSTLTNSNSGGSFGSSIHIEGNYAIIGDVGDSSNKDTQFAFVYKNNNGTWEQKGQLSPQQFVSSVRQASDGFGKSVRINYPYAFVGAPNIFNNNGEVFIFKADETSGNWTPILTSPNVGTGHRNNLSTIAEYNVYQGLMGQSIDIGDDFLFIGIPGASSNKGQVKIMKNISGDWAAVDLTSKTTTYTINNPNNTINDQFGFSVSYYDNYLVIGSPNESSLRGSIYLYKYDVSNDRWELKEKKMSRNEKESDKFGYSVAIFKKKVVVGTGRNDNPTNIQGGFYYLEIDDNDKLNYPCPRIQAGLDKQNGPLVVGISDYLVAGAFTGSELIRFYQNHSSIKTTNIVNTNFTRTFIGSAGGKLNEIRNHLDLYYDEAYSGTMGVSFNVANYSLNDYLNLEVNRFNPRFIPTGPKDGNNDTILNSDEASNVAGNFWYSIFKKFNEDKDINSLQWRIGETENNSEN